MKRLSDVAKKLGLNIYTSYITNVEYDWHDIPKSGHILLDDINKKVVFNAKDFGEVFIAPMARVFYMEDYYGKK